MKKKICKKKQLQKNKKKTNKRTKNIKNYRMSKATVFVYVWPILTKIHMTVKEVQLKTTHDEKSEISLLTLYLFFFGEINMKEEKQHIFNGESWHLFSILKYSEQLAISMLLFG